MTIKVDPEENETGALLDFVDLDGAGSWRSAAATVA
jgi:hypothetical protein